MARTNNFSGGGLGCQAEIGCGAAMAAAALVQLQGGTVRQACDAASMALQCLSGLVCDPVAGTVQVPCIARNMSATATAFTCANAVMAGFDPVIPFDEEHDAFVTIGKIVCKCKGIGATTTPTGQKIAAEMQKNIAGIQAAIRAEENNIAAIEAEIRRQEEEARRKAEAEGKKFEPMTIGNISFTWPCPGHSRITSGFGDRESPTEGASTNHKGVDVGAPTGSKVVAAAGGTVVISQYSSSAGNYIMISHGGGVYSVYMHLSSLGVSKGATVKRGDTIGAVGSTGYSTGPHLHFGIRINGGYVNPLNYVRP